MRTQRNYNNIDFLVVNFINHTIVLVNTARPCLFKNKMFQVFHLSCSSTRMLLKLQQQICYFLDRGFISTFLNDAKFGLCSF